VFLTNTKHEVMEVLTGPERRRRWSAEEKLAMVRASFEPGKSVSMVARQHGVNPNQLSHWRKLYQDGSLSAVGAGEEVAPASELSDALKQIRRSSSTCLGIGISIRNYGRATGRSGCSGSGARFAFTRLFWIARLLRSSTTTDRDSTVAVHQHG
jgi:transposase-like protein